MTAETYLGAYETTRAATNRRINMNFFCHRPPVADPARDRVARTALQGFFDEFELGEMPDVEPTNFPYGEEIHRSVMASRPGVVSFHFGLPAQHFVDALKADGAVILSSATTAAEARDLVARGVDAVIAQGSEAGGHHGFYLSERSAETGTFALVPQIVDAVSVPVIAAGGIADGRGIAAALALGAAGAQIGTAFLTSDEAGIPAPHRRALLASDGSDTRPTRAFSGRPARGIRNRYMDALETHEDDLPDFPLMNTVTAPLRKKSADMDSPDFVSLWSGQAVGLNRTGPVAEIVEALVAETRAVLGNL